jgi:serine/threonine-protein kinase RsbW
MLVSTLAIPGHPEHVRAARTFTALVLEAHGQPDDGAASLLVSELVTNSLLHSDSGKPGGTVAITVLIAPGKTRIQVTDDGGPTEPAVRPPDGTEAEDGRGLRLVRELSGSWGFYGRDGHVITWFELPTEGNDDMSDHVCGCGYQADSGMDLGDHLGEVFSTGDDIAPDGRLHAEAGRGSAPGRRCLCGFAAGLAAELDSHLLQVFTPDDCVGRDSAKHSVAVLTAPEHGQLPG